MTGEPLPRVESRTAAEVAGFRWLRLERARWVDASGRRRDWELASRVGGGGAVAVLARRPGPEGAEIVVVRQFRPPVGAFTLEFPAGLVDAGESPEAAALRELREETGFAGRVVAVHPALCSSPGLTDESVVLVEVELGEAGAPEPDEGEHVEVLHVPQRRLRGFLAEAAARGDRVDAKLGAFAAASLA